ncbi:MAG: ureidoglycolate lyase [Chloroflexi bacterium]|nr:ureidoglycolate lyase [Chloroflexota bacterium]
MRVHRLKVELLTEEAFAPFGEVLEPKNRPPDYKSSATDAWIPNFQTDGTTQMMVMTTFYEPLRFTMLERHLFVTQTFLPTVGAPSVVVVGAPTDPTDRHAAPLPEELRAFLLDGTKGYLMLRGTWHSMSRFPLYPPSSGFVIITDEETTEELRTVPAEERRRTHQVDYAEKHGITFELEL